MESHEAINFMSLYSLVASSKAPPMEQKKTESTKRLSVLQLKHSQYQIRDSILSNYKISPELTKALGIDSEFNTKSSVRNVNIGYTHLKNYKRNSVMIRSLTNVNSDTEKSVIEYDFVHYESK
jgi:hypothetical protein